MVSSNTNPISSWQASVSQTTDSSIQTSLPSQSGQPQEPELSQPPVNPEGKPSVRYQLIGGCMALALLLTASNPLTHLSLIWPGLLLWSALALSWSQLAIATRRQAGLLMLVGFGGMGWGVFQGADLPWQTAISSNGNLLAMLMAVSFLSMVAAKEPDEEPEALPEGRSALKQTLAGVHLFGAVINMSIVFIMADRFASASHDGNTLKNTQHQVLSRAFCAGAFWSPFFAAVAVALTYAPGANLLALMQAGIPLAITGVLITYFELRPKAESFTGYPMRISSLALPAFLALAVISAHYLFPTLSVLQIISILSPLTAIGVLLFKRKPVVKKLRNHTHTRLARMGNELALFLAAGTMAAGLGTLFTLYADQLPIPQLTPLVTSLLLLAMLVLSLLGVHPVISIATISGLMVPTNPPMDLLAMVFLASWGIGTACSPMSGMNLSLRGRYFISAKQALRNNLHYGVIMWLITSASLWYYNPL